VNIIFVTGYNKDCKVLTSRESIHEKNIPVHYIILSDHHTFHPNNFPRQPTIQGKVIEVADDDTNTLYLSTNGLKTSTPVLGNLNHPVSDIVFAPSNRDIVYAIIS